PFGQVVRVLADLPGLSVSAGGISRQLQRLGEWLDPYYERVKLALRAAPRVNGDETGWRTNGHNGYLWTVTDPRHTLYHVDKVRRELTRFLWDKHLDGTNNAAERALRPAVVMRKITGGSRSGKGAQAWAKLASLMRTASQQGRNVLETVKQLLVEHWAGKPAL